MYLLPVDQLERLLVCVEAAFPREASGLLLRREAGRYTVLSVAGTSSEENTPVSFRIRDATVDRLAASLAGSGAEICGCFHSHVLGEARPSRTDRAGARRFGGLWLIYSVRFRSLNLFAWDGAAFRRERLRFGPPLAA